MPIVESAYPSLLQGVSQQDAASRREGQLREQLNMWSDPTYGLRRRTGVRTRATLDVPCSNGTMAITEYENSAGTFYLVWNLLNDKVYVFNSSWVLTHELTVPYLSTATSVEDLAFTSVGKTGFVLNRKVQTSANNNTNLRDPRLDGFVLIRTGAFEREYSITVNTPTLASITVTYTTGTTAATSTPEAIATGLMTALNGTTAFTTNYDVYRDGALLFITRANKSAGNPDAMTVTTNNGSTYVLASTKMLVPTTADLPAKFPSQGSNAVLAVGNNENARSYYTWVAESAKWVETAIYGSNNQVLNMPLPYTVNTSGQIVLESNTYPLRTAGDDNNNPYPNFVGQPISGIGSYQGRLVVLSGAYATLSSSLDSRKLMRTTVSSLVNSDGFEVSSSKVAGASFKYCVQFNKDLLLLGDKHQAVIPSDNKAIGPTTGTMVHTGNTPLTLKCQPVATPRVVLVPNSNRDYLRIGEIVPSDLIVSLYNYQDVTDHIPAYILGDVIAMAESSVNAHAVFLSNTEKSKLLSHEYYWDNGERKQMAFSMWDFGVELATVYYTRDTLVLVANLAGKTVIATMDGKQSFQNKGNYYLDFYKEAAITANKITIPAELQGKELVVAWAGTDIKGEPVGIASTTPTELTTVRSFPTGSVVLGIPFTSSMSPSNPILKDSKDVALTDSRMILKRYLVALRQSGEFDIEVSSDLVMSELDGEPVLWRSPELGFNKPQAVANGSVNIPIGIPVEQSKVVLKTTGTRELNIRDIQYTLKVELRQQRRRL